MTVSQKPPCDLPDEVRARLLCLMQEMWRAVVSDAASASEAEEQILDLCRQMGREVLSSALSERYGRQMGPRRECACGRQQRFEGYRTRTIVTALGTVPYRRAYYRCAQCGSNYYAGEERLGLLEGSFSIPAQEMVTMVCSEMPFERGRHMLRQLSGLEVSVSHAERLCGKHGERLEQQAFQEREALFAGELECLPAKRPERLYVALDGTMTRFVDQWHETRVGAVYDVAPDEDGMDQAKETTYVSGVQESVDEFGKRLYQEAEHRGVAHAKQTIVVADGAVWIWNLAAEHFPDAVEILDFYHASKRLHTVGKAVYGEGTKQAKAWAEANAERLLEGGWKALLCSLRALRPKTAQAEQEVRRALGYFQTNRHRMDYPSYRSKGYHIGSGVVESACSHVVGARCKGSGMRWSKRGAQHVLALRCTRLNGRWDQYWQPLKAAA